MKKYFMYAALASMMFVGCQNEGLIDGSDMQGGEEFTLVIEQGAESRTELNQTATVWSVGDEIYVTSLNGKVKGKLTYQGNEASATGQFKGYVFGGKAADLKHVIFPVPEDGKVVLNQPEGNKLDLPMFGEISDASATLNNVCAMVNLPVSGAGVSDGNVDLSEENGMLTGYYKYDNGSFNFVPDPEGGITVKVSGGKALFATATTNNEKGQINLIVEGNENAPVAIPVTPGQIEQTNVPNVEIGEDGIELVITNEAELVAAFAKGGEYTLKNGFELKTNVVLEPGVKLTINGGNNTLNFKKAADAYLKWNAAVSNNGGYLKLVNVKIECENFGIWSYNNQRDDAGLELQNCEVSGVDNAVIGIEGLHQNAVVDGGKYTFDGVNGRSVYAFRVVDGANATINTTVDGGLYGGALDVQNASAYIKGIKFTGAANNGQTGIHIYGSDVTLNKDENAIECSSLYIRTENEDGTNKKGSVVNGMNFEAGASYEGASHGFRGTLEEFFKYIEKVEQNN